MGIMLPMLPTQGVRSGAFQPHRQRLKSFQGERGGWSIAWQGLGKVESKVEPWKKNLGWFLMVTVVCLEGCTFFTLQNKGVCTH